MASAEFELTLKPTFLAELLALPSRTASQVHRRSPGSATIPGPTATARRCSWDMTREKPRIEGAFDT
jgi:hypothetical protein